MQGAKLLKSLQAYWLTCVLLLTAGVASATTIVMPSDEQLIEKSPVIVEGIVVSTTPVDRGGSIWTETLISVERSIKGDVGSTVLVREPGGVLGENVTVVFGTPRFTAGERVLAFLSETERGDHQTIDLFVGKFSEQQTLDGQRLWVRNDHEEHVLLLDRELNPTRALNVQRDAAGFENFINARTRGIRVAANNYFVANPVLAKTAEEATGRLRVSPDFTLIDEPTIYRWTMFASGGVANWFHAGTQPGYPGGGVNELRTAMAAWTGYANARINYAYAGQFGGTPRGNTRSNGTNEVLFNDPLGEIAGTWDPSKGGVVGQGGFNGVANGGRFSGPFNADATHTTATYNATAITEGNLVIQDNVSAANGISANRLAEIISHEFGHTLGFGHSADSTALMYASITGLGPSLRADDQTAARWLYPGTSSNPQQPVETIPTSPANLTGSASGTNGVALQWTDRASNETVQTVFYAESTGSFVEAGDVGANQTGATITGLKSGTAYRFYVTASNSAGQSAASNTVSVTVGTAVQTVTAGFRASTYAVPAGTSVQFFDESTGNVTSRSWSFGDGGTSTAKDPSHTYSTPGQYTVRLSVSNGTVSDETTRAIAVTIPEVPFAADFSFTPANPVADDPVTFSDLSTGGATQRLWNFGDGTTSSEKNPVKRYASAGNYSVTLTAYRGSESRVASKSISVGSRNPAQPPVEAYRSLVSVTAQTDGAGGSQWRTELTLFNAGTEAASINLVLIPSAGGTVQSRSLFLMPRQTRTYENTLLDLFGISSGAGALAIEATSPTSTPELRVTSRTFTSSSIGTYGQAVPDIGGGDFQQTLYVTGMAANTNYRTNIGLVNRSASPVSAALTLFDDLGNVAASTNITLPANNFQQSSLQTYFPSVAGRSFDALSMRVIASAGEAVSVYGSVVDNRTQDPIYLQAMVAPSNQSLTIPTIARLPGANNTFWRSDVTIFNPGSDLIVTTLRYYAPDGLRTKTQSIPARRTIVLADVVTQMGAPAGSGALEIAWTTSTSPIVTSRTYTTAANGGSYGQAIDPAQFRQDQYVTGLRSDISFRSNLGFVNSGTAAIEVEATLLSATGTVLGTARVPVPAKGQVQYSVNALFPSVNPMSLGNFTLQARGNSASLFAYGSIVDNGSGDPVFIVGR